MNTRILVVGQLVLAIATVLLGLNTCSLRKEIYALEARIGKPSSELDVKIDYAHGKQTRQPKSVWSRLDEVGNNVHRQQEELSYLSPLLDADGSSLRSLASIPPEEMNLFANDSFWNWYRIHWLEGDLDQDGIANGLDACPDVPAVKDAKPAWMSCDGWVDKSECRKWYAAHSAVDPFDPNLAREERKWTFYGKRKLQPDTAANRGLFPDEVHNLYYGCPEEKDADGDGVADYRDQCPNTPKDEKVVDHHFLRGPKSLFPKDQGCSKSQLQKK